MGFVGLDPDVRLCSICQNFDVRSLLIKAEEEGLGRYESAWDKISQWNVQNKPEHFFRYHPKLSSLKLSAEDCDLCNVVWETFSISANPLQLTEPDLRSGLEKQQIYIGCTPVGTTWHRLSQVVVFQHGQNEVCRTFAWLDVYADRGNLLDRTFKQT